MTKKAFIEHDFPLKEVSFESAKEKSIRHGHISTLHIWWARRPLASSRASILAALVPDPENEKERQELKELIAEISKWKNSLNPGLLEKARSLIKKVYPDGPPKVLDCFAGGGAIPLEALRLGCETYALDLNPVANIILKATLEYPQKYGQPKKVTAGQKDSLFDIEKIVNPLVEDVKKWGNYVLEEARKEFNRFYPQDPDKSVPVGYIWARTVICTNPRCATEIPLMKQFWLVNRPDKKIALKPLPDKKNKIVKFEICENKAIKDYDPSEGTTSRATVLCPVCNTAIEADKIREQAQSSKMKQRLLVVITLNPKKQGKLYRLATDKDRMIFEKAEEYLKTKVKEWKWDIPPVPDEYLNQQNPEEELVGTRCIKYNMKRFSDLFNSRQKLVLIGFVEKLKEAQEKMIKQGISKEYAKVIMTYLSFCVDRLADYNSMLCLWHNSKELVAHTFGRQAMPMVWDYIEINPFSDSTGNWDGAFDYLIRVIEHISLSSILPANVQQGTATRLPFEDGSLDAVITDPPYYDNINYAELADFFYVWLKRSIGELYPDLLSTPLSPKGEEIVQNHIRQNGDQEKAKQFFEKMLTQAFKEINRVLKPNGISVIVFAHKSTEAWETIINSLLSSGLVLTGSWPLHTEMQARLTAKETASLASSIYMVCRKRAKDEVAYYDEIKEEIKKRIKNKLAQFWNEGISGSDFFVSAIGPAVEVFGKYSKVEKPSGEEASAKELLEYVRKVVMEFALERILKNPSLGGIDSDTLFYLLWRWTYNGAKVHFDDANKLAHAAGVELSNMWADDGFVRKEKEFISVLDPRERAKERSFLKKDKFNLMIDVLHRGLIYWEKAEKEKIKDLLDESGFSNNENFWKVAQAISEVLHEGDKEKQLMQGFLYSRDTYSKIKKKESDLFVEGKK